MHTKGLWEYKVNDEIEDDFPFNVKSGLYFVAAICGGMGREEEKANARLIAAAVNSYDKHCGERAVECAEGDLLGDLLEALEKLVNAADMIAEADSKQRQGSVSIPWGYINDQREAIRKAKGE